LDGEGKEITATTWPISGIALMNASVVNIRGRLVDRRRRNATMTQGIDENVTGMFYVTPFVGCAGGSFMQWQDFIFQKDDLAKIKQVRIEPAD
jgi:hypothetical protein